MNEVGVIVGRFQIDTPHAGHRMLIEEVHSRHSKVLICLGCAPVKLAVEDALDYSSRAQMMQSLFPWATIMPIQDCSSDREWSKRLDEIIASVFPTDGAILYGSRQSFIGHYFGRWPVVELKPAKILSGTDLRQNIAWQTRNSEDFRAGVFYACANRYPISYQTVDAAILSRSPMSNQTDEIRVLLGRKDGEKKFRFIGGFVDTKDLSLEASARREVSEEVTQIEVDDFRYICSMRINDWRYQGRTDQIMTAFFSAVYVFGAPVAGDDIVEIKWVPLDSLSQWLIQAHLELGNCLIKNINQAQLRRKS